MYDIIVQKYSHDRAKLIAARLMASSTAISLQKALFSVEKVPFVLLRDLTEVQAQSRVAQLHSHGIETIVADAAIRVESEHENRLMAPGYATGKIQSTVKIGPEDISNPEKVGVDNSGASKDNVSAPLTSLQQRQAGDGHASPSEKRSDHRQSTIPEKKRFKIAPPVETTTRFKKRHLIIPSGLFGVLAVAFLIITLLLSKENRNFGIARKPLMGKTGAATVVYESNSGSAKGLVGEKSTNVENSTRQSITASARNSSQMYLDSARFYTIDHVKAVNFYKIAISFNKFNLNAWYGLLDCYRVAGLTREFAQTKKEMETIFGNNIFSISTIIDNYGILQDLYLTDDNVMRIEYMTRTHDSKKLEFEVFTITKALRTSCNCKQISLFASTRKGAGLVSHIESKIPLNSFTDFSRHASLTLLQ